MRDRRCIQTGGLLAALCCGAVTLAEGAGYLRNPDIEGDTVVFVAEGDLWSVPAVGGTARRLTSHVGTETFPRLSPDGRSIAFTGEYDGNADVFVVPLEGGEPRRLTWHPASDLVLDWTPDGARILFASPREDPHGETEVFSVPAGGGEPAKLLLGTATALAIDPASGRYAFNRTSGGGTWKRYRGGSAQTVWVGHPDRGDYRKVTDFDGLNAFPMWHEGRIYYLADLGGTANLWSMQADGTDRRQHTTLDRWDARNPSIGSDGRIVFMLAGGLHVFDPRSGQDRELSVELPSDRVLTRSRYPQAAEDLSWFELSPDGERLVVTTRGEIFSVPVEPGVTLPVTRGSGARESWASFDAEGKRMVYVTDAPGEEELRVIDAWGRGEPKVVKPAADRGWHYPPVFAPDGKRIAYADQTQTLYVAAADGGASHVVDRGEQGAIEEYAWSPDGRWLAYGKLDRTDYGSIYVYDVEAQRSHRVTGADTDDGSPAWDPEGRYLYFLSGRTTNPLLDERDLENVNIRADRPYLVLLRDDVDNPFAQRAGLPEADDEKGERDKGNKARAKVENEREDGDDDEKGKAKGKDKDKDKDKDKETETEKEKDENPEPEPVAIEFEGLEQRIVAIPVEPGDYASLSATAGKLFYLSTPLIGMAEWAPLFTDEPPRSTLVSFDLEEQKAEPFVEGVSDYRLAHAAGKIAVMKQRGEIYVIDAVAPPEADLSEAAVALDAVIVEVDPRDEWKQIFDEGWRHMRDFYWDATLAGVDWRSVHDQYATLLPRLATRGDLTDLMAEMIGELSTSHTYVFGGDAGIEVPDHPTGLLGADLVREGKAFRIARIYHGSPADGERSPLLEPGVNLREGQYILAINHRVPSASLPFEANLEGSAETPVLLTVGDTVDGSGSRDVVVVPLGDETGVRYADWVRRNRERVARETGGKIGYVHIPDMMGGGLIEFNTWFYAQLDREGLVVDVRWNSGGFVSQMILERLRRPLVSFDRSRGGGISTYPYRTLNGPFVVLTNEHAGSDGDIFPAAVQLEGLAPVIGTRSWGGVVGIEALRQLVDGGLLTQPQSAWWDTKRGWELENRGVDPDIVVDNLPQDLAKGADPQLDRAIREVLRLHAAKPPVRPGFGPARPRGRDAYRKEIAKPGR